MVGTAALVLLAAVMVTFKPWLLFVNTTANDALPITGSAATPGSQPGSGTQTVEADEITSATSQDGHQGPVLVASGSFVSHEHTTTGTASIYRLPDGRHQLALADLSTTNGPDVHVWLSAGPAVEGRSGWFSAGDHAHLDVSPIKANRGNQLYDLPQDFSLEDWQSVDLWCEDFSVSFGAASLTQPA